MLFCLNFYVSNSRIKKSSNNRSQNWRRTFCDVGCTFSQLSITKHELLFLVIMKNSSNFGHFGNEKHDQRRANHIVLQLSV